MRQLVRVALAHLKSGMESANYFFDLIVNEENRPVKDRVYFGLWGGLKNIDDRFPLLLEQDGEIDLGADHEPWFRWQRTNILDRELKIGERVTMWVKEEEDTAREVEYTLEIVNIYYDRKSK